MGGADRAIIFDPAWNPAVDAQACDRIYRVGQTRDCIIYRFITCGTVEEKIYQKQIFKKGMFETATNAKSENQKKYFTKMELKAVFELKDAKSSSTCKKLLDQSGGKITLPRDPEMFMSHLNRVKSWSTVYDVSHHDLLFQ